ncbi:MAG TPA: hypothetical protein VG204_05740 [Terriglobia bacterium]|nr:hypothetical protein [Terriglobia bacterium]
MREILEFTKSVGGQWKILLGGAAVVGALLVAEAFLDLSPPSYVPWAVAATCLILACCQSWKDEHLLRLKSEEAASPSPQVLVHFDCEADSPKPLSLINVSDDAAFNVKVDDIQNAGYVAKFDVVSHLLKEWVAIVPRVEGNGNGALGGGNLMTVLQAGTPSVDASRVFPVHVSYTNFQGRPFKMQYDIYYDALSRRAVARLNPAARQNGASHSWME